MKTCILFSGLPRFVESGCDNIKSTLIDPNDTDVFVHTWGKPDDKSVEFIKDFYKPIQIMTEDQRTFSHSAMDMTRMMRSYGGTHKNTAEEFITMLYSSWYSILMCNIIKEQYRLHHNINYDYVIRARFDIVYHGEEVPLICTKYDPNILHTSNREVPINMIDDGFAFGSNKIMNTYCNGFTLMEYLHDIKDKQDGIFCGESIVYETVKLFNINHKIIDNLHRTFVRR